MKLIVVPFLFLCFLACSNSIDNWLTFKDGFNIGSISLPNKPNETIDTTVTSAFKLISSVNLSTIDNKSNSPSTFGYDLYFPTEINEFDFFKMKKDPTTVSRLFDKMILGAQRKSDSEVKEKIYFDYPEPGVKVILLNKETNQKGICRIIIFDNYIIMTSAVGTYDHYTEDIEDKFFKTLKVNSENRNRGN
jgi:hypothetical protein